MSLPDSPLLAYRQRIASGVLQPDSAQLQAAERLDADVRLVGRSPTRMGAVDLKTNGNGAA